ncbi:type III-A CRISPR-associated protein Csm2 [Staphylococcus chromogenes]|uniref:type III-A CRISPR-associated protein Csm2 n=1 Tax=Staphylococcus chromogenes TaxID=46126 RepID=UPI002886D180|nr:type III-A CRISPR-associated protein Csm2 [Staphylococcus chromogenes]MDT0740575.1 type III-A CRISPR-associated protein Csm2 [Staphylococcus chromogenes]
MKLAQTKKGTIIDLNYAHEVIKKNRCDKREKGKKTVIIFEGLTTSKLRGLLEKVNRLHTIAFNIASDELPESFIDELEYLKVKFYYEAGRETSVNLFLEKTFMIQIIDRAIQKKSKKYFLDYCKYFEALVAYAKYYQKED